MGFSSMLIAYVVTAQSSVLLKYLPADASLVAGFNPVRLAKKVPGETFRQSKLYEQIVGKEADLKKLFEDPARTGIDFDANLWIVATKGTENPDGAAVTIYGLLKNESAFSGLIGQFAKGDDGVKKYGTDRQLISAGGPSLAWNNEVFVIAMPEKNKPKMYDEEVYDTTISTTDILTDTTTVEDYEKQWQAEQELKMKMMRDRCFALLTPKKDNQLIHNRAFMYTMTADADIRMWSDGSPNAALQKINPFGKEMNKLSKLSGQNKTSLINFENGKITATSKSFLDDNIAALYGKHKQTAAPVDMLRRLPSGNLLGVFLTSFNTDLARDMMNERGLAKLMDSVRSVVPFVDKITEAFKGNMMVAVMKSNNTTEQTGKLKGVDLIIAIPVANKARLEEIHTQVKELMAKENAGGKTGKIMSELKPVVKFNDQYFVVALSEPAAQSFLNSPGTNEVPAWVQSYQQYPTVANLSFRQLLQLVFGSEGKGGAKAEQMKKVFDNFDGITFSGGHYADKSLNSTAEFTFTNKQDNAMLQIFHFINQMMKEKKAAVDDEK